MDEKKEQMSIVIVGHVDHGKSTVIGRLLADTNSLPMGKLEQVKQFCANNSKPFEYAFLLDALKDEQKQGITIDSARCFFKTKKRDYTIIDAPGHIEFLKNMISGAARAEAALLVIDAKEGIKENSKRHGFMLSLLGIKQVIVCINKMDLINYDQRIFEKIKEDYSKFLKEININPKEFIPLSAFNGENITTASKYQGWFKGNNILSALDSFEKEISTEKKPFRFPVQEIYKFTERGDDRRIIAGRIESGAIKIGEKVIFLPSNKISKIKSIEEFNSCKKEAFQGDSTAFTLEEQIYVRRGEIMCKEEENLPHISSLIKAHIFWMGRNPLQKLKEYKLKIGTEKVTAKIKEIINILDASNLAILKKDYIEKNEVAEVVLECAFPIAFDISSDIESTGRFVLVDGYDISGGGIITENIEDKYSNIREQVILREKKWDKGGVSFRERISRYSQIPKLILITGITGVDKKIIARELEKALFKTGKNVYFLGIRNILRGLDADIDKKQKLEHIRRLGEVSHILIDAGLIVVETASDLGDAELKLLQTIVNKEEMMIINIGKNQMDYSLVDLNLETEEKLETKVNKILDLLKFKGLIFTI